ncbi:ABC transporter ATP-binding protein [Allopontixanthobacter sp.]|uniref:ABC transporter ATP-binding protein n=1 Tax=Allopontixanthobacter sp. TaxID=2906452 RepID=UPI002ABAF05B|nr:ABC transporter ATP-binding protein [Allopontixanthobacter sp.]MDZ4306948.1 ABC transporter ATP-binding protein [Allopontixanthobacter sp.]
MSGFVQVEGLGKQFRSYSAAPTLKQAMLRGWRRKREARRFWALRDVSFEVQSGSMLAVIGRNGSGKSTLLRLLGGVLQQDTGSIRTEGPVSGLLELNSGVHPDLTGRENLLIGGVVAGLSISEVRARFDEIVAFAELEDFIDHPVRTYSAGMKLRLGFSVASHARSGVLLIDEVLAVGDLAFQAKCLHRIQSFKEAGGAIVVVTHDLSQAASCDQALWLDGGKLAAKGNPHQVAGEYRAEMTKRMHQHTPNSAPDHLTSTGTLLQVGVNRFGSLEVEILDVTLLSGGRPVNIVESGSELAIEVQYASSKPVDPPILVVSIGTADQEDLLNLDTVADGVILPGGAGTRKVALQLDRLDLAPGNYYVNVGLYKDDWDHTLDFHWHAYPLTVVGDVGGKGVMAPPRRWRVD